MWVHQLNHTSNRGPASVSRLMPKNILPETIAVMLVACELPFCKSLQVLLKVYNLSSSWQIKLVGEASSIKSVLTMAAQCKPGLIFLDWDLFQAPDQGIEMIRSLSQKSEQNQNGSKILVLSSLGEESSIFATMQAGAWGYLLKENLPTQLPIAMTAALNNQVYLCPEVTARFFRAFQINQDQSTATQPQEPSNQLTELNSSNPYNLTNREREVLKLLVEGYRNQEIARSLYITVATVKAHLTTIFEKLEVDSRSRAIVRSLQMGLV
ncbi:Two component transcriptional regulator, LuxR family [Planktothrix sp. PCC 11201]|nr:Two component transcriptional regulator, LuxR family [Planktothrix sp. PCC 11201]